MNVFNAIAEIQDYEKEHFGETYTDITSSEKVANMLAYIYGELVLYESATYSEEWDNELQQKHINLII